MIPKVIKKPKLIWHIIYLFLDMLHKDRENFFEVTKPYCDEVFPEWWNVKGELKRFINDF